MPKRKMYQWDTKIHARCLCIGKEVLKYTDIKILKKVKELKKKKKLSNMSNPVRWTTNKPLVQVKN